ncbi:MAG: cupin domain-containing protein [Acidobacteriota bacterium]|nr:cupin domain-containing protein [Acidobacteriota bacterium]
MKFTIDEFLSKLPLPADEKWKDGVWDIVATGKKNVSLVFFAPRGTDYQTFHDEDEFYFIIRGSGELTIDDKTFSCKTGDTFFVPATVSHHFENFTDDFATWAIFF